MIPAQKTILEQAKQELQTLRTISTSTVTQITPHDKILKILVDKHTNDYLNKTAHNKEMLDMFRTRIKNITSEPNTIDTLVDSYTINPYYSNTNYDRITHQTTTDINILDSVAYSKKLTDVYNILHNLETSQRVVSSSELSRFDIPTFTRYNTVTNDSFDSMFTRLYSYLYTYYVSYENSKASTYLIEQPSIPSSPQIDTYAMLYTDTLSKLGDIIKYHDMTYSTLLQSFDTASTIDNIVTLRQNNKYLTTNPNMSAITHNHVHQYMTTNNAIIPSAPESEPVIVNEYENRLIQLFRDLPTIIPYTM